MAGEKPIDKTEKWTEVEHLPLWDEEFYQVYTAKKYGKWVMLKALKPEFKDDPFGRQMIEKEFDTRYNLAHPSIVMINDYEEVPGVGMAIITDDVYGDSLAKLIREGKVTRHHIDQLCNQMVDAMEYIQGKHLVHAPLRPERIIFTENIQNLKLIDVGYDQHESLTPAASGEDIEAFGRVLDAALDAWEDDDQRLRKIAARCRDPRHRYHDIAALRLALADRSRNGVLTGIAIFMAVMLIILIILTIIQ